MRITKKLMPELCNRDSGLYATDLFDDDAR